MGMSLLRKDVTSDIFSESILAGIQKLFLSFLYKTKMISLAQGN